MWKGKVVPPPVSLLRFPPRTLCVAVEQPAAITLPTDIYVFCCSYTHNVAPRDKWIAFVSTTVETSDPQAELAPGETMIKHLFQTALLVQVWAPRWKGLDPQAELAPGGQPFAAANSSS